MEFQPYDRMSLLRFTRLVEINQTFDRTEI